MLKNNLKLAWRNLFKNKAYTFLNVAGLAVGMAGAILIYLVITYHTGTDAFHSKANRIYRVTTEMAGMGSFMRTRGVPHPIGDALRSQIPQFEQVAMTDQVGGVLSVRNQHSRTEELFDAASDDARIKVVLAEPSLLHILDFKFLAGNSAQALVQPNKAVITKTMALKLFHTVSAIGQIFSINHKKDYQVSGVVGDYNENTDFPFDIYLSYSSRGKNELMELTNWGSISTNTGCLVLMRSGNTPSSTDALLAGIVKKSYPPKEAKGKSFSLQNIRDIRFDEERGNYGDITFSRPLMFALIGIGLVLLLTACINFINLSTAIASSRAREVGVKKVLGSLPSELLGQFITETAVITFLGWVVALILVAVSLPLLKTYFNATVHLGVLLEGINILFFVSLFVAMVALSGFYPGKILAGYQPVQALKNQQNSGKTRGLTLRKGLVIFQFTISQVLIFGTLIMVGQIKFIKQSKLGFSKDSIYMVDLPAPETSTAKLLRDRLRRLPGVKSVSMSSVQPMSFSINSTSFTYNNRPEAEKFTVNTFAADSDYLNTYNIKLVAGRNIHSTDSVSEYLVNETLVGKLGVRDPKSVVGKLFKSQGKSALIVGVVSDFHTTNFKSTIPPLYIATEKNNYRVAGVKLNSENILETKAKVEEIWKQVYPGYIFSASFFDEQVAKMHESDENLFKIIDVFAIIAILIGCLGLFGLISYTAVQRTKEIGIRKVLGASSLEIIIKFILDFGLLIVIAFVIAAPLGYWIMTKWLQDFEFKISINPLTFLFALAISCIITLITISLKTYQAAVANPIKSLRTE